jgi:predicted ABC-type ATPase
MVATVVVLYGPKAAGKSQVAAILRHQYRLVHIDPDLLVLDLLARGDRPDPQLGWLLQVEDAIERALQTGAAVAVEATGAWDSDWQLTNDLEDRGHRVLTVWVSAPLELTLRRLRERTAPTVPVTQVEARAIWTAANDRARNHTFDLTLDTAAIGQQDLPRALAPLTARLPTR